MRLRRAWIAVTTATLLACMPADRTGTSDEDATVGEPPEWDIPIERNGAVERWLDYFQTRGRKSFEITLARAGRYERRMREILREAGLPEDLVYISMVESGFRPTAHSRARALGLWQFVPGTARLYGLESSYWIDERLDPIAATRAAADYLEDLQREFGDWYLTAAAYNGGPGRVQRAIRRAGGVRDFWTLARRRLLRRETRDYVPKLIAVALIAKQPERYGFRVRPEPIATFDIAYVPDATSLDVVADAAGVPFDEVLALNLHLIRGVTPPGRRYPVRIPAGTPRIFAENYAELPPAQRVGSVVHVVRRGDTLGRIAGLYRADLAAIRRANDTLDPLSIRPGQRLLIPGARDVPGLVD